MVARPPIADTDVEQRHDLEVQRRSPEAGATTPSDIRGRGCRSRSSSKGSVASRPPSGGTGGYRRFGSFTTPRKPSRTSPLSGSPMTGAASPLSAPLARGYSGTPRTPGALERANSVSGAATPVTNSTPRRGPEQIVVQEADFRRCGHDLNKLRERDVRRSSDFIEATEKWEADKLAHSFKSSFEQRCRRPMDARDPWKNLKNPELSRPKYEGDMVLNQVWALTLPAEKKPITIVQPAIESDIKGEDSARSTDQPGSEKQKKALVKSRTVDLDSLEDGGGENEDGLSGSYAVRQATKAQKYSIRDLPGKLHHDSAPRVAWLALDPESGELQLYRKALAERLESAHKSSRASVPLAGLGRDVEDVIVVFLPGEDGGHHAKEVGLDGKERFVRRILVPGTMVEMCVSVWKDEAGRWRYLHEPNTAASPSRSMGSPQKRKGNRQLEFRTVPLSATDIVPQQQRLPTLMDRHQRPMTTFLNFGSDLWG